MKILWHLKSRFYHQARTFPLLRWILEREKTNLRDMLPERVHEAPLILDIGTGAGSSIDILPGKSIIVAVDRSIFMLQQAKKMHSNLFPVLADSTALPFKSTCIVFCTCIGVTEYVQDIDHCVDEITRILSDSGILLITGSHPNPFNYLRFLLGHRLYLRKHAIWDNLIKNHNLACLNYRSSWLQMQWLLKKIPKI